jgi:16S rRNA (guanine966-N2)-methyltransferase
MKLRVIAGEFGGRRIDAPRGYEARPTAARAKEALFSSLESRLDFADADALDLYAASGALGIEALSRGARSAVFVDRDRGSIETIRANVEALRVEKRATIVKKDARAYVRTANPDAFDLVLADPPYADDSIYETLDLLGKANAIRERGVVVVERAARRREKDEAKFGKEPFKTVGEASFYFLRADEL